MRPLITQAGPSRLGLYHVTHTRSCSATAASLDSFGIQREDPSRPDHPRKVRGSRKNVNRPEGYEDAEFDPLFQKKEVKWHRAMMVKNRMLAQGRRDEQYRKTMGTDRHVVNPVQPSRDFESVGFGVPGSMEGPSDPDQIKERHPGAPPKQRDLMEDKRVHQFREGGFKDGYYHDPFADSSVSDSIDFLREALYPSIPHRGRATAVDPAKVVECCQRLSPPKETRSVAPHPRLVPLDPYVDKIFSTLVPEYSTGPLPTPVHQLEVLQVLERCLGRVIARATDLDTWRQEFDHVAEQYARVLIHQTRLSQHDPARLDTLLRHLDRTLEHYASTTNYYIPVPLVSSLVLLMKLSGQDFRPSKRGEFYSFVWPAPRLVVDHLGDVTTDDVTAIYLKRPLPYIPSTAVALDKTLRELCIEDSGLEFARVWRRYRDLYDTPDRFTSSTLLAEPLRKDVLSIFYYRLTHHFARDRDWSEANWKAVPVEKLKEEIISRVPKPYPVRLLHGMVFAQTRPVSSFPSTSETTRAPVDLDQRTALLSDIWRTAHGPGQTRDIKFYGLFVTAMGSCNRPGLIRKAWEACIDDTECRKATESVGTTSWPPPEFFNQVVASLLKSGGEGVTWAFSLFDQACAETSSVQIDHYTLALILEHHARTGQVAEMQKLIELGAKHGLEPNAVIYGTLIKGMLRAGQFDLVDSTLQLMSESGITPSKQLLPTLVSGLCRYGEMDQLREAERLLALAKKYNVEITVFTWASLIGGYFTGGWSHDGWDAVRRMEEAGVAFNRVAYNMIIKEAGKTIQDPKADVTIGMEIVKRMMRDRIYPGHKTWELLLLPLVKAEKWETAQQIVDMMQVTRTTTASKELQKLLFSVQWRRKWKY